MAVKSYQKDRAYHADRRLTLGIFVATLSVLGCALWIILSLEYSGGEKQWAYAMVGMIVVSWLAWLK